MSGLCERRTKERLRCFYLTKDAVGECIELLYRTGGVEIAWNERKKEDM